MSVQLPYAVVSLATVAALGYAPITVRRLAEEASTYQLDVEDVANLFSTDHSISQYEEVSFVLSPYYNFDPVIDPNSIPLRKSIFQYPLGYESLVGDDATHLCFTTTKYCQYTTIPKLGGPLSDGEIRSLQRFALVLSECADMLEFYWDIEQEMWRLRAKTYIGVVEHTRRYIRID